MGGSFFFKYWSAQRDRGGGEGRFFLSTGLPNGSGGVFFFFKYWSAQRVWSGFRILFQ